MYWMYVIVASLRLKDVPYWLGVKDIDIEGEAPWVVVFDGDRKGCFPNEDYYIPWRELSKSKPKFKIVTTLGYAP